jgi:hypothetical protein
MDINWPVVIYAYDICSNVVLSKLYFAFCSRHVFFLYQATMEASCCVPTDLLITLCPAGLVQSTSGGQWTFLLAYKYSKPGQDMVWLSLLDSYSPSSLSNISLFPLTNCPLLSARMPRRLLTPADEQLRARRLRRANHRQQGDCRAETAGESTECTSQMSHAATPVQRRVESERPTACLTHDRALGPSKWYVAGVVILLVAIISRFLWLLGSTVYN